MLGNAPPTHLLTSAIYADGKPRGARVDARRIAALFRPHLGQLGAIIACLAATSLLGLLPALAARVIVDRGLEHREASALLTGVAMMAVAAVGTTFLTVYQGRLSALVAERVLLDVRGRLLRALYDAPLTFFSARRTGEIVNRVFSDPNSLCNTISITLSSIATNAFVLVTSVVAMLVIDWKLALAAFAALPLMVLPLGTLGRRTYPVRRETFAQRDRMHAFVEETVSLRGVGLIKAFGRHDVELQRAKQMGNDLLDIEVRLETTGRWFTGSVNALAILGPAAVWLVGGWLFFHGSASVGTIVAFVALLGRVYAPASALAGVHVQILSATALFERVFELIDLEPEQDARRGGFVPSEVQGHVAFENVGFSYAADRHALDGVTFDVPPGACVGVVGASGSGKTTLAALLLRFFDPGTGVVRVDGRDLRSWDLKAYRSLIGVVQQETLLCHDTIANNIRYGRVDASDDEVVAAARAANVHDTIEAFPEGYGTIVGEGGHRMSGGERQRIAIARALLRDPRILILDEATSSLDSENERLVQAGLQRLMRGRTSIVIAHRLSTLASADAIVVLDHGRVVGYGTHEQLLRRSGHYTKLYGARSAGAAAAAFSS